MKSCQSCGSALEESWSFCRSCGGFITGPGGVGNTVSGSTGREVGFRPSWPDRGPPSRPEVDPLMTTEQVARIYQPSREEVPWTQPTDRPEPTSGLPAEAKARKRPLVWIAAIIAGVLLLGGVLADLGVRADLSETRATLTSTTTKLEATKKKLATTTADRNHLKAQLEGVRGTLKDTKDRVELQAGQISSLKTCLKGVSIAFDDILRGDFYAAAGALEAVRDPCDESFKLF